MSKAWKDWDDSAHFERFHTDRGVKKKQQRGDRHAHKQKMKEAASDVERYFDDLESDKHRDDNSDGSSPPKQQR